MPTFLHAYNRRPKQVTTGLIPDDGFREKQSTNTLLMQNPDSLKQKEKPIIQMLNSGNYEEQQKVYRPVSGLQRGIGAPLPSHSDTQDKRYFVTEYESFYGGRPRP